MDVSQYLEIFIDESEEHLQTLSDCIMVLEKEPDNKDTINEVFRAAHSLKGMAGTMGFKRMQHLTHDMENVFQEVRSDHIKVTRWDDRSLDSNVWMHLKVMLTILRVPPMREQKITKYHQRIK